MAARLDAPNAESNRPRHAPASSPCWGPPTSLGEAGKFPERKAGRERGAERRGETPLPARVPGSELCALLSPSALVLGVVPRQRAQVGPSRPPRHGPVSLSRL